jgi:hypothetical protein
MFASGQAVVHPSFGIGIFTGETDRFLTVRYGKETKKFIKSLPVVGLLRPVLRPATEAEQKQAELAEFLDSYTHSALLQTYLHWLRCAGPLGVVNDCGCAKNSFYNYTCACRSLVKLYHRFSVFKDELTKRGFDIRDIEMENGKHKTVLVSEPYTIQ